MRHVWQNLRGNYVLGIKEIYETLGCLASKNKSRVFWVTGRPRMSRIYLIEGNIINSSNLKDSFSLL